MLAGVLLARLAEANREGVEQELEMRLPVLSALGLLSIDPAAAEKVLHMALEVHPLISRTFPPFPLFCEQPLTGQSEAAEENRRDRVTFAYSTLCVGNTK